jgi:hypothetical protein
LVSLVKEATVLQFHRSQYLHAFPLTGDGHSGRAPDTTPSRVNGGILAKAGLVGNNQRPTFAPGFFFRRG